MKKFQKHDQEISLIFNIIKWKFTKGTNNKLLAALFDISGDNLSLRVPFNRRSWVTRLSKIFKKLRECVFLPGISNLAIFFEKKMLTMKTARITGYFSDFYVVNHVVKLFSSLFFTKRYIYKFPTSLLKKDTVTLFFLEKIDFFSSKKMPP